MRQYIEKIKDKPHHVRHMIALGISGGCTLLLLAVWITQFSAFNAKGINQYALQKNTVATESQNISSPFQSITASAVNAIDSLKEIGSYFSASFGSVQTYTAPPPGVDLVAE